MTISIHSSLYTPCAVAQSSTLALDLVTTFGFLLLQVTKFLPKNMQFPNVDLLTITLPKQSASVWIFMDKLSPLLTNNPLS